MVRTWFSKKRSLFSEYYKRDMIAHTYSVTNLLSVLITIVIVLAPFIINFTQGCKF
jgi:hypothetical protein